LTIIKTIFQQGIDNASFLCYSVTMTDEPQQSRLDQEVFDLPTIELRAGYRSACYFSRAKYIMEQERPDKVVTMQVFQKGNSVLCGIDEAIAILRVASGTWKDQARAGIVFNQGYLGARGTKNVLKEDYEKELNDLWVPGWNQLTVKALHEGDEIEPWEPVMTITGPYALFAHLESVYLGVLARRTKVATNTRRVCQAANGKPMLFFADRFDHYATQGGDGFAAMIGGATGVATDAMGSWWGEKGMGTTPHALIAAFDGNTVEATQAFAKYYGDTNVVALVDFENDCVQTSLDCARTLGDKLWGVRLDTSENMVDQSLWNYEHMGESKPTGVNPQLVRNVREALDAEGFDHVKIIVSGGFNVDKITAFEKENVPVDVYAVGSSLLQGSGDFTSDVVLPCAKRGRWLRNDERLELVK
jgi:nicotinate phosphoribosyltransferase